MRRLFANAFVQFFARNLDLLLLGNAVKNEVGLKPMRCQAASAFHQFFLFALERFIRNTSLTVVLHQLI